VSGVIGDGQILALRTLSTARMIVACLLPLLERKKG
jgi:hypothetical protein